MRHFDTMMRKWKGQEWIDYKNDKAISNTNNKFQQTIYFKQD